MTKTVCILWLKIACVVTIVVGLVAAAASTHAGSEPWRFLFDLLTWPIDGNPGVFPSSTLSVNAVLGGVMVGWGTLMYLLVSGPLNAGRLETVQPILIGIIVWFLVDSSGSFLANIPGNVLLNLSFLCLFVPPLYQLHREYLRNRNDPI